MLHWVDGRARSSQSRPGGRSWRTGWGTGLPVAGIVLAAAVAALGLWWLTTHSTVTLVVDGQPSTHETHAATVGAFLERAGVEIGAADEVVPAPSTPLRHGMRVEVVHAREVTLLAGDTERQVVASALTVDELLETLGPAAMRGDAGPRRLVRPSRLSRVHAGMVVELSNPVALTVAHDGRSEEVITTDRTVGDLLERLDVELGPGDRVRPAPDSAVEHGLVVTVERVVTELQTRSEPVEFDTTERPAGDRPRGQRREVQAGRPGTREVVEEVVLVDGQEESRTVVSERLVAEPVTRVVEVGTAVARSSGGHRQAGAAAQPPAGEAPGNVEKGKASWYDNPYGGFTAAHRSIPRGTVVRVTNVVNGRSVDVRINDRGPFVAGRVIDLNRKAFAELASPSRGVVSVRIEW